MQRKKDNLLAKLILAVLLSAGFLYRIYGLNNNHSFWTDENHMAIFARAILERGKPVLENGYATGGYQWLQYWLSAISAKIFGLNEFAIRFPSVIFGVLTIWAVYLLGKELFSEKTGLIAAVFTTFLKIEILWSRQARPYQALQFFYLFGAYFIYKLTKEKKFNWHYFLGFLISGVLASLMHGLGLVVFFNGLLYLLIFRPSLFRRWLVAVSVALLGPVFVYFFWADIVPKLLAIGRSNDFFYYRVFLWHNYSLLVFLALVGFLAQFFKKEKSWQILVLFLAAQGMITSFVLIQPFVRYFYIVFPFLILLSAAGLVKISQFFKMKTLTLIILTLFVVAMGHKFTFKPEKIYSLNEDMRELPEVDWKIIYSFVSEKLSQDESTVLVTNWNDLPIWFLGEGKLDYFLRKPMNKMQEEDPVSSATIVYSLDDFREIIENEKKGILVLDSWDDMIPDGMREYSQKHLKKELEVDRLYPVQPRYWPVGVYSWGL